MRNPPSHTPPHARRRGAATAPTVVAALVASLAACTDADVPPAVNDAVPVTVVAAHDGSVEIPIVTTGTFASRDEIPLAFKIGGVIVRVTVDEGASVRRGQTLAALDLREIDAAVSKASVALAKATRDEARVRRLYDDSVATRAQWQDAQSALDAARADLASARVNREYAVIVAPEDGTILRRSATPGSNVAPGAPVLVLGGARRGRVMRAGLADRDAMRVAVGDPATVRFDAIPGREFRGQVTLLGRAADARTGTFALEVAMRDADGLPSGLVGQVAIETRGDRRAPQVPVDALVEANGDSATIYSVTAVSAGTGAPRSGAGDTVGIASAHRVRITALLGDRVAISGLPSGASVIARGAPYVTHGTRVRIVRPMREGGARGEVAP